MKSLLRLTLVAALCIALFACAAKPAAVRPEAELPAYTGEVTLDALRSNEFIHLYNSVRAEVKGTVTFPDGSRNGFDGVFFFKAPDSLRIRLYGPFGVTVADILNSRGEFELQDPVHRKLYTGGSLLEDAPNDIAPRIMRGGDIIDLVSYARLEDGTVKPRSVYMFEARTLRNAGLSLYVEGHPFVQIGFDKFDGRMPGRVVLDIVRGPEMDFRLIDPELNVELPENAFKPVSRKDYEVLPLSAVGPDVFR